MLTSSELAELIASVPHVVGSSPHRCLLVVVDRSRSADHVANIPAVSAEEYASAARGAGLRSMHVLRLDATVLRDLDPVTLATRTRDLMPEPLSAGTAAMLLLVGDGSQPSTLPHPEPMAELAEQLSSLGMPVARVVFTPLIARGARWHDYRDPTGGGRLPDPHATPLGVAQARRGRALRDGYRAVRHRLTCASVDDRLRVAALVEQRAIALARDGLTAPDGVQRRCLALVDDTAERAVTGRFPTSDEDRAEVLAALTVPGIRDAHLLPRPISEALPLEQLWITLLRVATHQLHGDDLRLLIAYSAYLRGDSTLAVVALGGTVEPSTPQALLALALTRGLPRGALRSAVTRLATSARASITGM